MSSEIYLGSLTLPVHDDADFTGFPDRVLFTARRDRPNTDTLPILSDFWPPTTSTRPWRRVGATLKKSTAASRLSSTRTAWMRWC